MAPSGGKTDDQVSSGYNREGDSFLLQHSAEKLGPGLGRAGEFM